MSKLVLLLGLVLGGFCVSSQAAEYSLGADVNFAAPIVSNSSSITSEVGFGSIVYDNTTKAFQGLDVTGSWVTLGVSNAFARSEIAVSTPGTGAAGYGTTNTYVRRFSNTLKSSGSAITFADSASLGSTFTINQTGVYSVSHCFDYTSTAATLSTWGITLNSTVLNSTTTADQYVALVAQNTNESACATAILSLVPNDIIRVQPGSSAKPNSDSAATIFRITRIGD